MKQTLLHKLIREEIRKVIHEYSTPYYNVVNKKKSELPKELQYHGDMKYLVGKTITAYWSEEELTAYVCTPGAHNFHAFKCNTQAELETIVMRYDKIRIDAEDDLHDKSKTHILTKKN